jgi:hypothetical protein
MNRFRLQRLLHVGFLSAGLAMFLVQSSNLSADSASGSLTSFSFHLTDLDPSDGVTPTLTETRIGSTSSIGFYAEPPKDANGPPIYIQETKSGFKDTSADLGFAGASTTADSVSFFASLSDGFSIFSQANRSAVFDLTPHTEVTFSAVGHAELAHTGAFNAGQVDLTLDAYAADGSPTTSTMASLKEPGIIDKRFTASARNNSSASAHYFIALNGSMSLFNQQLPPPVPEPATYVEMLLGLCIAQWMVSRSSRQRQRHLDKDCARFRDDHTNSAQQRFACLEYDRMDHT